MINVNLFTGRQLLKVQVPEGWNELTSKQLVEVSNILLRFEEYPMERDVLLVQALSGLEKKVIRKVDAAVVCEHLFPLIEWLREGCDLTKQLLPSLRSCGLDFYGPKEYICNITVGEFDFAERALYLWYEDPSTVEQLYQFLACLYRPAKPAYDFEKDPDGDCREEFNPNLVVYYAKILRNEVQADVAAAVALWYKGCRSHLISSFKPVFETNQDTGTEQKPQMPMYFDLIRAIAKEGIYGDFEAVFKMPLYTAMEEMLAVLKERQRMEQEMEAIKNGGGNDA